ncbi:MAG: GTP-binding protein [Proteobacteria bacterium]|nr:GTP-binding protein [Pseudomonadota bacterium]
MGELDVHLIAGFPYAAKRATLDEVRARIAVCEPDRRLPDSERVALVLPAHVEPAPLVEAWADHSALAAWAGRPARLRSTTVVLDADHLERDLQSQDQLSDRGWAAHPGDARSVADLLVEQVEAADHIVTTRRPPRRYASLLRALNPYAALLDRGPALRAILESRESDRRPWPRASWQRVRDQLDLAPGAPPSLLYRRHRPFNPTRFEHWIAQQAPDVLRAKGRVWLADRPDVVLGYSRAAAVQRLFVAGRWWASVSAASWPRDRTRQRQLLARWDPRFGDRHQEVVLLGPELEPTRAEAALDACLATDAELANLASAGGAWPGSEGTSTPLH